MNIIIIPSRNNEHEKVENLFRITIYQIILNLT